MVGQLEADVCRLRLSLEGKAILLDNLVFAPREDLGQLVETLGLEDALHL